MSHDYYTIVILSSSNYLTHQSRMTIFFPLPPQIHLFHVASHAKASLPLHLYVELLPFYHFIQITSIVFKALIKAICSFWNCSLFPFGRSGWVSFASLLKLSDIRFITRWVIIKFVWWYGCVKLGWVSFASLLKLSMFSIRCKSHHKFLWCYGWIKFWTWQWQALVWGFHLWGCRGFPGPQAPSKHPLSHNIKQGPWNRDHLRFRFCTTRLRIRLMWENLLPPWELPSAVRFHSP